MHDFSRFNDFLNKCTQEVKTWSPDRFLHIDLETLYRLGLLHFYNIKPELDQGFTQYFQIEETAEKITLANDEFIIWIVPEIHDEVPVTCAFIALNQQDTPKLEVTFLASGVYNNSKLIMRVLEKLLTEIKENEDLLSNYRKEPNT